jgi:hypothetical protein
MTTCEVFPAPTLGLGFSIVSCASHKKISYHLVPWILKTACFETPQDNTVSESLGAAAIARRRLQGQTGRWPCVLYQVSLRG